jgi:hypothetical protein
MHTPPALALSRRSSIRALLILFAVSFGSMVVASRVGVILHELAGHALMLLAQGGEVRHISVTYFGGGHVSATRGIAPGTSRFLFDMSGIFVNGILGAMCLAGALAVMAYAAGRRHAALAAHVLAWCAVLNLAGATHYACIGSYYSYCDSGAYPGVWAPALALLLIGMPVGVLLWSRTLAPLLASFEKRAGEKRPVRIGAAGLVLASATLLTYLGGLLAEQRLTASRTQFATLQAQTIAIAREMERVRQDRIRTWRQEHGSKPIPKAIVNVTEEEIDKPFPLLPLVLIYDALLILVALLVPWRLRDEKQQLLAAHSWAAPPVAAAGLLLLCGIAF